MYARLIGSPNLAVRLSLDLVSEVMSKTEIWEAAMAPISSAGSFAIPAAQPARRQAESSVSATETELTVKQEQQVQRVDDNQSRGSSDQVRENAEKPSSPPVAQADDEKSAGEQQKIEAAQQEAQRAEFNQQAGNVRDTEPDDVRPPSSDTDSSRAESPRSDSPRADSAQIDEPQSKETEPQAVEVLQEDSPAIDIFKQTQNINAQSRQGQAINQFA